jgi:hypothetical protein
VSKDPWTDPDPQPGDFDAELERLRPDQIERHEGNPDAKLKSGLPGTPEEQRRLIREAMEKNAETLRRLGQ